MVDGDAVRSIIERQFRVYDEREERFDADTAAWLYFIMFRSDEFDVRYEQVRKDIQELDPELLVFLRHEGGEDILFVAPRPRGGPVKNRTNLILLIATLITTTTAGAVFWEGFANPGDPWRWSLFWDPVNLMWGSLTFALPLMLILGVHESAHFIAARRHGLRATLPYFIPVPPVIFFPIGTFGAFIRLQDPLPDRKALFDVGASGPLAGFVVAVPLLILGTVLTDQAAVDVPDIDRPDFDGAAWSLLEPEPGLIPARLTVTEAGFYTYAVTAPDDGWEGTATATIRLGEETRTDSITLRMDAGETYLGTVEVPEGADQVLLDVAWDDHLVQFGDPLLVMAVNQVLDSGEYLTHPTFFAAWVGILVTGINLLPAGQLDGGHVARALLGERVRIAGLMSLALLMFLAFRFSSWLLMALFLILTGLYHPPPLNDRTPLDNRRKLVGALVVLVFIVTFVPVPIHV